MNFDSDWGVRFATSSRPAAREAAREKDGARMVKTPGKKRNTEMLDDDLDFGLPQFPSARAKRPKQTKQPMQPKQPKQPKPARILHPLPIPSAVLDEHDTPSNPYPMDPIPREGDWDRERVTFVGELDGVNIHEYTLHDEQGSYKDLIVSATSLLLWWTKYCEAGQSAHRPGERRLEHANRLLAEDKFSGLSGYKMGPAVALLSYTLEKYTEHVSSPYFDQVMTFAERAALFTSIQRERAEEERARAQEERERTGGKGVIKAAEPKDFSAFVQSIVYREIEAWFLGGCAGAGPFVNSPPEEVMRFVAFASRPGDAGFAHIGHLGLRAAMAGLAELHGPLPPVTGQDIANSYSIAGPAGTALHEYLEYGLANYLDPEWQVEGRVLHPCQEEEDYIQAEQYVAHAREQLKRGAYLEVVTEERLSSYAHMACGSADIMIRLADGSYRIEDHKRTAKYMEERWFGVLDGDGVCRPSMQGEPPSSLIVKHAFQAAAYRKFKMMQGFRVSTTCAINVCHPLMPGPQRIEIDLTQKTKTDLNGIYKDLGVAEYGEAAKTLSPIELVELVMIERKRALEEHFRV